MSLVDTERAFVRLCFAAEPDEGDLTALGSDPERWLLYRRMVQSRLLDMLASGLPRTRDAIGAEGFDATFGRWLEAAPPRTRFIRDIVPAFAAFAASRWTADAGHPAWLVDLARYEAEVWDVGWAAGELPPHVALVFDRRPVVHPAARTVVLDHPVHRDGGPPWPAEPTHLLLYRRADHGVSFRVLGPVEHALVEVILSGERTLTEASHEVARDLGVALDGAFVERLGELLAALVDQGVVLGARP